MGVPIDIEKYYKQYGPMVLRRCRSILRDQNKAMDAMQDVFVNLMRYKDKLTGQYPSSLLYRMATNICLNILRRDKIGPQATDDEILQEIAGSDDVHGVLEARDVVDRIFTDEKESTKTIAVLYHLDGLTLEEVAGEVGMSVSGVRKRLRNLREKVNNLKEV
jgi:RNA polymerase sigma-70 factor (ECF subfamily)